MFEYLQPGDTVKRRLGGIEMLLVVGEVDEEFLYCGTTRDDETPYPVQATKKDGWKFDRVHGVETDEQMGWGVQFGNAMSYLLDHDGSRSPLLEGDW